MKIRYEYGDLVVYVCGNKPQIGRYVRKDKGKMIIVPECSGKIKKKNKDQVVKLSAIYLEYKDKIKKQTWSLQ